MKIIKFILAIIFTTGFAIALTAAIFLMGFNNFVSKGNVNKIIDNIGIEKFIELSEDINPDIDVDFLKVPEVKELMNNLTDQTIEYIFYNKGEIPKITDEEINRIVDSPYYEEVLGFNLTSQEKEELRQELKETYKRANEELENSVQSIQEELYQDQYVKLIFSAGVKNTVIISLIVLGLLIALCRWSLYRPLAWYGTAAVIAGLINVATGTLLNSLIATFDELDMMNQEFLSDLLDGLTKYGIICALCGAVLIIMYFIIRNITENRKENETLNTEL